MTYVHKYIRRVDACTYDWWANEHETNSKGEKIDVFIDKAEELTYTYIY